MAKRTSYHLSLDLNENVIVFFPEAVGKSQTVFRELVVLRVRKAFSHLKGVLQSVTASDTRLEVVWQNDSRNDSHLDAIAEILTKGNYADGIFLLELFLSNEPDNPALLYNLGMAYSDKNNLGRAIELLQKLVLKQPDHVNGRVALGVALLRNNKDDDAIKELKQAVATEPKNLWANRNLGAGLMRLERYAEAEQYLKLATEIGPDDQASWYGYAQALEYLEKFEEADNAYITTIQVDEFSKIADLAKQARSKIAQRSFRSVTPGTIRMDAVMYCLGAMEKFESKPIDEVQKIGFEIAILGTRGIDVNSSEQKYTLRSMPGKFSGLHLLCLEYVAFKQFAPEQNIGFDLSQEYQAALSLFGKKVNKE